MTDLWYHGQKTRYYCVFMWLTVAHTVFYMTHLRCSVLLALEKNITPYVAWYPAKLGGIENDHPNKRMIFIFCSEQLFKQRMVAWKRQLLFSWPKPTNTRPPTADVLASTMHSHLWAWAIAMSPAAVNSPAANGLIFTLFTIISFYQSIGCGWCGVCN